MMKPLVGELLRFLGGSALPTFSLIDAPRFEKTATWHMIYAALA